MQLRAHRAVKTNTFGSWSQNEWHGVLLSRRPTNLRWADFDRDLAASSKMATFSTATTFGRLSVHDVQSLTLVVRGVCPQWKWCRQHVWCKRRSDFIWFVLAPDVTNSVIECSDCLVNSCTTNTKRAPNQFHQCRSNLWTGSVHKTGGEQLGSMATFLLMRPPCCLVVVALGLHRIYRCCCCQRCDARDWW